MSDDTNLLLHPHTNMQRYRGVDITDFKFWHHKTLADERRERRSEFENPAPSLKSQIWKFFNAKFKCKIISCQPKLLWKIQDVKQSYI